MEGKCWLSQEASFVSLHVLITLIMHLYTVLAHSTNTGGRKQRLGWGGGQELRLLCGFNLLHNSGTLVYYSLKLGAAAPLY